MVNMTLKEIVEVVDGSFGYPSDTEVSSVCTDTRAIKAGCVFIALKGENFDGHDFAAKATELGAEAVITERPIENAKCIVVDSTRRALLNLASHYRNKFKIPLVGVTGSVGKTSTKEMIASVLSQGYKTLKTEGNHNNEIGLPLTLFEMEQDTQAAVIEMGMNHFGEISRLSLCACPTIAVITNIGFSHIENLGTQEGILKAKMEILDGCSYEAPLVVNGDDKLLASVTPHGSRRVVTYSLSKKSCDVYASDIKTNGGVITLVINSKAGATPVTINCYGEHNIKNALAAFAVGLELGMSPEDMAKGIAAFKPDGMRQNIQKRNGITLIIDCYNAAPDSMKAGISVLSQVQVADGGRRIAVVADMLEMGKMAPKLHKTVGEALGVSTADMIFCFGDNSKYYIEGAVKKGFDKDKCFHFDSREELAKALKAEVREGDAVWFKGSRGMKLEEVVDAL
ncbi:MAG: UDP-N-acetylmuramoyl-tripeptide--D-alanyl-D-alanine ligase [Ruminococcus sp.]|nr:UDP-N-acetylmuramoyl-tripeptide--D-alanyl-D-alanine ligase [Ruminococcus sp.]